MTKAERLLDEILHHLIAGKKSVDWVEDEYNIDAKAILRAWIAQWVSWFHGEQK